jgi:hypothetical protein
MQDIQKYARLTANQQWESEGARTIKARILLVSKKVPQNAAILFFISGPARGSRRAFAPEPRAGLDKSSRVRYNFMMISSCGMIREEYPVYARSERRAKAASAFGQFGGRPPR